MSESELKRLQETLPEGERALFERALEWLRKEKPSEEQIALKIVLAATKTYELTKAQFNDKQFMAIARMEFLANILR